MVKKPYYSKTLWLNFVLAALALFAPNAGQFIASSPELVFAAFAAVNMVLRLITKSAVQLTDSGEQIAPPSA